MGVLDTIRVRRMGYPVRKTFEEVARTYAVLTGNKESALARIATQAKQVACEIMTGVFGLDSSSKWQCGTDRIFVRTGVVELLDAALVVCAPHMSTRASVPLFFDVCVLCGPARVVISMSC